MKMEKGFFLAALLACAANPVMASPSAVAPHPANDSRGTVSPAGPPTPAEAAAADPASEDMAARIALDQAEAAAAPVSAAAPPSMQPARPAAGISDSAAGSAGLGGILGLGLSAAFLALGLLFLATQRRHLQSVFRRPAPAGRSAAAQAGPAKAAARSTLMEALRSHGPKKPAASAAPSPAPQVEVEGLRQLARELQGTISELRAERARWEKEWEQREMQWSRRMRSVEVEGEPQAAPRPARAASWPDVLLEAENDSLPSLADAGSSHSGNAGVLQKVEQLLAQGMSAEEISRRLRVGLREIQWMMRLGSMEARS